MFIIKCISSKNDKIKIRNQKMEVSPEELCRTLEFKDISHSIILKKITALLQEGQVGKLTINVTFRSLNRAQTQKAFTKKGSLKKITNPVERSSKNHSFEGQMGDDKNMQCDEHVEEIKFSSNIIQQAVQLYNEANYPQAIAMLKNREKQLKLKKNQDQKEKEANKKQFSAIALHLGNCYFRLKNIDKAIEYYQKKQIEEEDQQKAQRMNNLGTCYAIMNNYQQALKAYNQALKLYNENNQDMSSLLNNIGTIYHKSGMHKVAEDFFIRSISERKAKSPNNKNMLYNTYFELAICQKDLKKYDECIKHLNIAYNYTSQGIGNSAKVLKEICLLYEEEQKYSEALSQYEKLSEIYERKGISQGYIYERVSKIHEKMGNLAIANRFSNKAYKIYLMDGDERKMSQISGSMSLNAPFVNQY